MQLGIFARTFTRPTVDEVFKAVNREGFDCLQFNFSCAGLPTLPDKIEPLLVEHIRSELKRNGLVMAAVSGTCNLIHPEAAARSKNLARLGELIRTCPGLESPMVTLCTGTRDPQDMWRADPNNELPDAWRDLIASLELLLPLAQEVGVVLGIEPEPANVINSAGKARKLLDQLRSPFLKVIFDAANLLAPATLSKQSEILSEAIDRLGPDIVLAHAKDLGEKGHVAAGRGGLDYSLYISLLQTAGFNGPLILHNLSEAEVPAAVSFLNTHLGHSHAVLHPREH